MAQSQAHRCNLTGAVAAGRAGRYSGSDLADLCREAAMAPLRELGPAVAHVAVDRVRAVALRDFTAALACTKPSVGHQQLQAYEDWTHQFGSA